LKYDTLIKIRKICVIALPCVAALAIALTAAGVLRLHNAGGAAEAGKPETQNTSGQSSELTETLDKTPDNCTLNQKLPDLSFTKENGDKLTLSSMRGKIVVLTFWASWCPHCQEELKQASQIKRIKDSYKDADIWLVDKLDMQKETKEKALSYLADNNITLGTLFDQNLKVYNQLGLKSIPTTLVIDKNGVLRAWSMSGNMTAGTLESMVEYAENGGASGVRKFITGSLTNSDGGIKTNYSQADGSESGKTDVLSESQGLIMEYAVREQDKALFSGSLSYVNKHMKTNPLVAWAVTNGKPSSVNAALDDLRIYRAISDADGLWGGYSAALEEYGNALYTYNTDRQKLVNCYDFEHSKKSSQFSLCYADFETLNILSEKDTRWKPVYQNSLDIVKKGFISDRFPLYYNFYDYSSNKYDKGGINMAEEMETLLHLAKIGQLPQKTITWLQNAVGGDGIYARYQVDGSVASGYDYESTAVYGLASMIGDAVGDEDLAGKALIRMEKMRVFDTACKVDGAFGNSNGKGIYSFDQCVALLAYSNFDGAAVK